VSKRKATIILSIIIVLLVTTALFIFPLNGEESFQIGKSNWDFFWVAGTIKLGLDLKGGMYAVYEADLSEFGSATSGAANRAMDGTIKNLENLLFSKGYREAVVTRQGANGIRVEVPDVSDTAQLMALLGEPAKLEFKDSSGNVLVEGTKHLDSAEATYYQGQYAVSLKFNSSGTRAFAEATANNIGNTISIYINDRLVISPTVNSAITDGNAVITGNYTYEQANELAIQISAGSFDVSLTPKETRTISPTLGQDALKYGIIAGLVGLIVVVLIMFLVYKGLGLAASLALIIYTTMFIYALALFDVQLSLPGIAGVILSIGMATDANIVIFERIKDERWNTGRGIRPSIKGGFKKAMVAIIDSNITTILATIVMLLLGSIALRSFAITLLIGVVISMFTAIFVTRLLINIALAYNDVNERIYGLAIRSEEAFENE